MRIVRAWAVVLLWSLAAGEARFAEAAGGLRFERISLDQGLSQSTVNVIFQDRRGFLWIGTQDGLNRYDGYGFAVFRHDPADPGSLSGNVVRALHEDRAGVLWVGTDAGLDRFDPATGSFRSYRHDPGDPGSLANDFAWVICEDRTGTLWIGTEGGGLHRFDRDRETFVRYRHDPADPGSLAHDEVRAIVEDRSGALWIATDGGGLDRLDTDRETFVHHRHDPDRPGSLAQDDVVAVYEDATGELWIATESAGLDRLDRRRRVFVHHRHDPADPASLGHDEVRVIYEDRAGTLWVGTDGGGLSELDRAAGTFRHHRRRPGVDHSLANDFVRSIFEDRSNVLWIGTDGGGLAKLDRQKNAFRSYRHDPLDPDSPSHDMVFSIVEDHAGELWIGTWGGLDRVDRQTGEFTHYRHDPGVPGGLSSNEIWPLYEDRAKELWIGTFNGLDRLDRRRERWSHYRHDAGDPGSLSHDYVRSIHEDREGVLWVGTDGGLNALDRERRRFTRYRQDPGDPGSLGHDDVRAIYEDRSGALWVGTAGGGLAELDRGSGRFRRWTSEGPGGLRNPFVRSIEEGRCGALWIGTGGGLHRLDPERRSMTFYGVAEGLPNSVVYGVLEDDRGDLWISTNGGLSRFDPRVGTFKNYDVHDGLQSNEFNTGAFYRSDRGELFFGGIRGLDFFFPADVVDNPHAPPVVLTAFEKFNRPVALGKPLQEVGEIELSHRDLFFSFEFAALDFRSPAKNRYAYRLEGFDDRWIDAGGKREATYTNIGPGRYAFRVRGSNNDGVWNEEGAAIAIVVRPPFWGAWWFRSAGVLAVLAALLASHRLLIGRNRRALEKIAERERTAERERLIARLEAKNDELERFTHSVAHDLKSPLVTLRGFLGFLKRDLETGDAERLCRDAERIDAAAGKMGAIVENLLALSLVGRQANSFVELDFGALVREALELVAGEIEASGVEVEVEPSLPLVVGDRERLVRVLQNLLQNAVKYMGDQPSPRIEIGARREPGGPAYRGPAYRGPAYRGPAYRGPAFYVRDNGLGIDPGDRERIFGLFERLETGVDGTGLGLALVQRIVEAHGGRIWVESKGRGHGSTFCFTLPGLGVPPAPGGAPPDRS